MTWAQRLKRVFNVDIETCTECGGLVKVIACIEGPVVIQRILNHLKGKGECQVRFGCPRAAARRKRAYLGKENPFVNHKDVAGDTGQGWRSADGLV